ncbi:MAG: succinate dehydrogenase, cytochrome b556 subunit [Gallionella sp.]|nr:succinate dehydrogenase, cytochrome b556 subunit [Gallionella sp.]
MTVKRPKHLALHQIRLPLPGFVSILHRVSGLLLFLALPLLLWVLQASLRSIETYTGLVGLLQLPVSKLALLVLLWAGLHHLCAGVRFLLMDFHLFSSLAQARSSSMWVLAVSLSLTVLIGVKSW